MGNPGRPSTSWPSSLEVVSWAAEKSDYLLLPVPPTERERVCVTVCLCVFVRASSHLNEECMTYIGKPKLANGLIASPVFTPPAITVFCTLPAFLAPFAAADTDCQLTFADGRGFPYRWQDMMGQMKINGMPGVNEVIVAPLGKRRRLLGGLVRLMDGGEGESEWRLL